MNSIFDEIRAERARQDEQWGEQNHPDGTGSRFEVLDFIAAGLAAHDAREICERHAAAGTVTWAHIAQEEDCEAYAESDPVKLRAELIQAIAVKVAWVEHLDRRALAARCQRCRGQGIVPDWSTWDAYHGEPLPKPCPDCQGGEGG